MIAMAVTGAVMQLPLVGTNWNVPNMLELVAFPEKVPTRPTAV
jgi:hypothetical protein